MIQQGRTAVTDFRTRGTRAILYSKFLNIFSAMFAHKVNDAIRFRLCLIRATGTFQRSRLFFGVFRGNMYGKRL
jgi:hypothetical protein